MPRKKMNAQNGFTLVELIVVMAIIVILSAVAIPSMVGFISTAKESEVLTECKIAVVTAQSLYIENYNTPDSVTSDMVLDNAMIDGSVVEMHQSNSVLTYLEYSNNGYTCIYAKEPENESGVDDVYTIIKNDSDGSSTSNDSIGDTSNSVSEGETSGGDTGTIIYENTTEYFYVHDIDTTYKVTSRGDIANFDFGNGMSIPTGWVFYFNGDYYITRNNQYLKNDTNILTYLQNYGMKINYSKGIREPSPQTIPGDIKLYEGELYVFFPYSYYEDYYSNPGYWFKIVPSAEIFD